MKRLFSLMMVFLLFAGCGTMQGMGGSNQQAVATSQVPDAAQDEFSKGVSAYQNEQYVNAEKHFRNVTSLDPTLADAQLNLALALYKQGKIRDAGQHFDRAQRLYQEESGMGGSGPGTE